MGLNNPQFRLELLQMTVDNQRKIHIELGYRVGETVTIPTHLDPQSKMACPTQQSTVNRVLDNNGRSAAVTCTTCDFTTTVSF